MSGGMERHYMSRIDIDAGRGACGKSIGNHAHTTLPAAVTCEACKATGEFKDAMKAAGGGDAGRVAVAVDAEGKVMATAVAADSLRSPAVGVAVSVGATDPEKGRDFAEELLEKAGEGGDAAASARQAGGTVADDRQTTVHMLSRGGGAACGTIEAGEGIDDGPDNVTCLACLRAFAYGTLQSLFTARKRSEELSVELAEAKRLKGIDEAAILRQHEEHKRTADSLISACAEIEILKDRWSVASVQWAEMELTCVGLRSELVAETDRAAAAIGRARAAEGAAEALRAALLKVNDAMGVMIRAFEASED